MTMRSCLMAISAIFSMVSTVRQLPVGLLGVLMTKASVIRLSRRSTLI